MCGSYVNDFLSYTANKSAKEAVDLFLTQLHGWGFGRVQVNATAVNGVFTENLANDSTIQSFLSAVRTHPELEFIVQKNEETSPLWSGLLKEEMPENIVFLHDESKGTGKEVAEGWPTDPTFVATSKKIVGFAGVSNFYKMEMVNNFYHFDYLNITQKNFSIGHKTFQCQNRA